jgi:hypothetical protein
MLARVSSLVAVLFVVGAVGLVPGLIVIGLRQRLELEIPPRTWPEPRPMSPTQRRVYVGLFLIGLGFWAVATIGAVANIQWLIVLGMSLFLAALLARVGISLHRAMEVRRARRARSGGG